MSTNNRKWQSETYKIFWDFPIQTDQVHNRLDRVVVEKMYQMYYVVVIACPFDQLIINEEDKETKDKLNPLMTKMARL